MNKFKFHNYTNEISHYQLKAKKRLIANNSINEWFNKYKFDINSEIKMKPKELEGIWWWYKANDLTF